jgi:hypothetical protein
METLYLPANPQFEMAKKKVSFNLLKVRLSTEAGNSSLIYGI